MSRYTVVVKLSMEHENGAVLTVGSFDQLNENCYRTAQQLAYQTGHRGPIFISVFDAKQGGYRVGGSSTFC
jgi:hypothetical protein